MKMPDIASAALTKLLNDAGLNAGISTGLNFLVTLYKAYQLRKTTNPYGRFKIVMNMNDPGHNYYSNYLNNTWIDIAFEKSGGLAAFKCWKQVRHSFDYQTNPVESTRIEA
ncbi:hypothetical protein TELCIR_16534 [Teladorsagia circumcincta]|uniref:Uncharacterized protein n=1 Tax=Teladorsagia circumcincta TaxID=45464 RepID=A0A2G9TV76_TELCI|nr:hypothetical protein TELCIR_16534 [Teladorsagia circumcincta]